jgi:hypothetical protein
VEWGTHKNNEIIYVNPTVEDGLVLEEEDALLL